jgi:hypothetical protein
MTRHESIRLDHRVNLQGPHREQSLTGALSHGWDWCIRRRAVVRSPQVTMTQNALSPIGAIIIFQTKQMIV